jgi:hypothetical protein
MGEEGEKSSLDICSVAAVFALSVAMLVVGVQVKNDVERQSYR